MEMMTYNLIGGSLIFGVITYWVYSFLNWVWFRPKKLEKCLRVQGFGGNAYRLFLGDQQESKVMIRDAMSRPITLSDDIKQRVIPHVLKTMKNHGMFYTVLDLSLSLSTKYYYISIYTYIYIMSSCKIWFKSLTLILTF